MHKGSLVRVGVCNEAQFAVDAVSDVLWFVAPKPADRYRRVPVRFVNSHLEAYLDSLCCARPVLERQLDEWARKDRPTVLDPLQRELQSIDTSAFSDSNSYWPAILANLTAMPVRPDLKDDSSLIECFGRDDLRSYSEAETRAAGLSGATAALLMTVGLPSDLEPYFTASDLEPIGLLSSAVQALHPEGLVRLGLYGQTDIAVDRLTGAVWQVDGDIEEPTFVNSTLRAYLECACHVWGALQGDTLDLPLPGARGLVERLCEEVRLMDQPALDHEYTYWSVIFEQLGYEVS